MPSVSHGASPGGGGTGLRVPRGGRRRVLWLAAALGLLAVSGAACTSGSATSAPSHSTPPVPPPVRTAVESMQRAPNFAFAATVTSPSGTTHLNGTFQAPDREDLNLQAPGGKTSEVLFVGTKAYQKDASGTWRDVLGGPAQPSDPRAAFAALLTARFGSARADVYPCTLAPAAATTIVRGPGPQSPVSCAVSLQGTTVSMLHLRAAHFDATIAYSGVGSTPAVPQP